MLKILDMPKALPRTSTILKIKELAELSGVSVGIIKKYVKENLIKCIRVPSGIDTPLRGLEYRFTIREAIRFLKSFMPESCWGHLCQYRVLIWAGEASSLPDDATARLRGGYGDDVFGFAVRTTTGGDFTLGHDIADFKPDTLLVDSETRSLQDRRLIDKVKDKLPKLNIILYDKLIDDGYIYTTMLAKLAKKKLEGL